MIIFHPTDTYSFFFLSSVVKVNSPYLEEHLMHMIKQDQSKVHNMDLLWRYYEKNRNFGKAAHVLARLADMHRFGHTKTVKKLILVDYNHLTLQRNHIDHAYTTVSISNCLFFLLLIILCCRPLIEQH